VPAASFKQVQFHQNLNSVNVPAQTPQTHQLVYFGADLREMCQPTNKLAVYWEIAQPKTAV